MESEETPGVAIPGVSFIYWNGNGMPMKPRYSSLFLNRVLRVTEDLEFQGHTFKEGDVFDWAKLGIKRYYVRKLFALKKVRHYWEDQGTRYPFRAMPDLKLPDSQRVTNGHPRNSEEAKEDGGGAPGAQNTQIPAAGSQEIQPGAYAGGMELDRPETISDHGGEEAEHSSDNTNEQPKQSEEKSSGKPANFTRKKRGRR